METTSSTMVTKLTKKLNEKKKKGNYVQKRMETLKTMESSKELAKDP